MAPKENRAGSSAPPGPWWLALVLLAAIYCGAQPYFEGLMNANERPRLMQAVALVEDGSLAIDGPSTNALPAGPDVARSSDGRLVPNKPPGATLPAAAAWLIARATAPAPSLRAFTVLARFLGGTLPVLILAAFWLRRLQSPAGRAAVLLVCLATPLCAQAHLLFGHAMAACLLGCGIPMVLDESSPRRSATGGLLAGTAVLTEYTAAFAGIPLAVIVLLRMRGSSGERRVGFASMAGAAVPLAWLALYHRAVFGGIFVTGYHRVVDPGFAEIHARGMLGLGLPTLHSAYEHLMSPWGGALIWAPVFLLGIGGLGLLLHRGGRASGHAHVLLWTSGLLLVVNVGLQQSGGWRVGPRYLVLVMPLVIPGLAAVLERGSSRLVAAALTALLTWSVTINVLAASLFPHLIPHGNPIGEFLLPLLWSGYSAHGLPVAIVLGLALAGTMYALLPTHTGRDRAALSVGAAAGLLAVGLTSVMPASPDAEANLDAVRRILGAGGRPLPPQSTFSRVGPPGLHRTWCDAKPGPL